MCNRRVESDCDMGMRSADGEVVEERLDLLGLSVVDFAVLFDILISSTVTYAIKDLEFENRTQVSVFVQE